MVPGTAPPPTNFAVRLFSPGSFPQTLAVHAHRAQVDGNLTAAHVANDQMRPSESRPVLWHPVRPIDAGEEHPMRFRFPNFDRVDGANHDFDAGRNHRVPAPPRAGGLVPVEVPVGTAAMPTFRLNTRL